ncbi:MAG TPA: dihydrofolate reductase family protein [Solirubrobacteraceae bacterium]|nr:dihydrofolate reductase family protein [Solirubrobacteraceae bacterium]
MDGQPHQGEPDGAERPAELRRLAPAGAPAGAVALVEEMALRGRPPLPPGRPRLILNMVSSADGRATLAGRSGPLSGAADRQMFHALRAAVDAVLVGAATARAERYKRLIPDARDRERRRARGLAEEPLACIVSDRLELAGVPLLAEPNAHVAILTASTSSLPERGASASSPGAGAPGAGARVEYVRRTRGGALDLPAALRELRERFGVELVLCEGGPHLARQLLAGELVDELFLTLSPLLAGDAPDGEPVSRILAGGALDPPRRLGLLQALRADSALLLRYEVLGV